MIITGMVALLMWMHLAWDYFHEGVPTHYVLHRGDLPGFSSWWGALTLPALTWFLLYRIQRRMRRSVPGERFTTRKAIVWGFVRTFLFGVLLSILFTLGSSLPGVMMIGLVAISFFIPVYHAEYLLGFVLGMTYTFGPVLPMLFGAVFWAVFALNYRVIREGVFFMIERVRR